MPIGQQAQIGVESHCWLDAAMVQMLYRHLPSSPGRAPLDFRTFEARIQEIAGSHRRQREQCAPSKDEARYQLALISHLTAQSDWLAKQEAAAEYQATLLLLNDRARSALWSGLIQRGKAARIDLTDLFSIDPIEVGHAAAMGWNYVGRGDYHDSDLHCTVGQLMALFKWAGGKVTYSRQPVTETSTKGIHSGNGPEIVGSRCGKFILAFFAAIEPDLNVVKISVAFKRAIAAQKRRNLAKAVPSPR